MTVQPRKPTRQTGVRTPTEINQNRVSPQTLVGARKVEFFAISFGDVGGAPHNIVAMRVGDAWYMPPNAEEWANELKPMSTWLSTQLDKKLGQAPSEDIPQKDAVAVLP